MQSIASGSDIILSSKPVSASIHDEYCVVEIDGSSGYFEIKCKMICGVMELTLG